MRCIAAVVRKEFLHILRDRRTLMLIIMMPMIQLIIYGFAVNTDVKHLRTILYDEDQTYLSRRLVDAFAQSAYFDIVERTQTFEEIRRAVDLGKAKVGLHIPPNFTRDLLSGRHSELQVLIDGTDSTPANTALNTSQTIVTAFLQKEGLATVQESLIDYKPRMWYNPDLKSSFFLIPGLVGFLIQFLIPMITSSAIVREKERGNIEQLLVSPIKSYEIITGKLIPYIFVGLLIAMMVLTAAHFLFHVPVRGQPATLFLLTLLFLMVCLGIGLFASTIAENQQQSAQIVMFFAAPSILLSGFIFPRETMPWPIFYLSYFIPLTHFLKIVRGITLKGLGIVDLWPQILVLGVMAMSIVFLSIRKFHKRLS
jgi:ABC-2 type transport system permease protein